MRRPHRHALLTAGALALAGVTALGVAGGARGAGPKETDPTLEAIRQTATAVRLATSGTVTAHYATLTAEAEATRLVTATPTIGATATATVTLCPLPPVFLTQDACCGTSGPACTATTEAYRAGICRDLATMSPPTATATETPTGTATPTATDVPTATATRSVTPEPTIEATPTLIVPSATPVPTRAAGAVIHLPFAYVRRTGRR